MTGTENWAEQEKERRSKFSWGQRRLEDGKMVGFTLYQIGGVLLIAAAVIVPWVVGILDIYEKLTK
jgi:hypothetical protein